ncbi:hypothetical protein SLEP1_g24695 [Rubroshorea leprosula]|uniref:Reverse transcriptase domain-containing protein n=1 Tax=Rubroshorea leprosula TaxID=152421 RepID=A0AAV5JMP4_9ROSI|nr:hypothetical protein SLEP1_g24695 [Rubroshorea leprosula]
MSSVTILAWNFRGLVDSVGRSGGLVVLWTEDVQIHLFTYSQSHIDMEILDLTDLQWHLTGFYGQVEIGRYHESWAVLKSLKSSSTLPSFCLGDFNEITKQSEKMGGNPRSEHQIQSFGEGIDYYELLELGYKGPHFTFVRKHHDNVLRERLDRVLMNRAWEEQFPGSISHHLPTMQSDHSPILIKVQRRDWSAHKFGNILERIKKLQSNLQKLHDGSASECSSEHLEEVETELWNLQQQEEIYWKQSSKIQWLKERDKNTSFFHTRASERRKKNVITELQDERGQIVSDQRGLEQIALHYFQGLFTSEAQTDPSHILQQIHKQVSSTQTTALDRRYTEEEVLLALKQIHSSKAPGPDGMNAGFFKQYWPIIGQEVTTAVLQFLNDGIMANGLNKTHIVLIPKKKNPVSMKDFCPISLCNVLYKLISKVLANRLKPLLLSIISKTQSAFVPGRLIYDNIMVALEMVHRIKNKRQETKGDMAINCNTPSEVQLKVKKILNISQVMADDKYLGARLGTNPSMVWRGVMVGLGVLKKGSCWKIGNGDSVCLWRDPWVPDSGVLSSIIEDRNIKYARVSSLMDHTKFQWDLTKLQQLFPSDTMEKISNIPLSNRCAHDRLICRHTINGRFVVKSVYRFAWDAIYGSSFNEYNELMKPVWSAIWHMDTVPKIKHFLWKFIWEILPTRLALQHRRVDCASNCCICDQAEESNYHLFFTCHWSKQVWAGSYLFFALNNIRSEAYLDDFLNSFLALNKEQKERVAVTLWCIWSNRNSCLFQTRCSKLVFTVRWISKCIREYTAPAETGTQIRQLENRILPNVWQPAQGDIIKLNIDAAVPQNPNTTNLGLGKEFGCKKIEIESNNVQAVAIANSSEDYYLPFEAIVEDLRAKKTGFDFLSIKHIKRSCNELAHKLAHLLPPSPP